MDTPAEFRKYAANCKKMSKVSEDPEVKALWHRMEERWLLCAKLAEEDEQSSMLTRTDPPVLNLVDPPSAQGRVTAIDQSEVALFCIDGHDGPFAWPGLSGQSRHACWRAGIDGAGTGRAIIACGH